MSQIPPPPQPYQPDEEPGFIRSLCDVLFRSFVTPTIVGFLYVVGSALIVVATVVMIVGTVVSASDSGSVLTVVFLVLAPLGGFFLIVMLRVSLEVTVVLFNIAEHLKVIRSVSESGH